MANEPKVLNVNDYQTATEKVSGGQGTSSATVSSAPKELQKSEQSQVGVDLTNVKGTATGNTDERQLTVMQDYRGGRYVREAGSGVGFERSVGDKNIVNTITVEEVKALIKKYGGNSNTYTKEEIDQIVETMRKGLYQEVNTTTYPTLEDFLDSTGEEGIIYLYPIGNEGNNYYQYIWETTKQWIPLGSTVIDLSNYPTLNGNNTFSGDNEFTKPIKASNVFNVINASDFPTATTLSDDQYNIIMNGKPTLVIGTIVGLTNPLILYAKDLYGNGYGIILGGGASSNRTLTSIAFSGTNHAIALLENQYANFHIKGITNFNGKTVPSYPTDPTTSQALIYDTDNTLKYVDLPSGFNVINASDIVNDTLTQAQYDLITNGKPTRIVGTWRGQDITEILGLDSSNRGIAYYKQSSSYGFEIIEINAQKVISIASLSVYWLGTSLYLSGGSVKIGGKSINHYLNNVYPYANNSTTTLQYETINNISISADTTFTLANAPSNTYPEYKANITNTDTSNAITITLPSGTVIKGNVSISSNTFEIPADSSIELNIQNGRAIVVEW